MENIWVIAADSVHARLFRAEHITGPLCEMRDIVNPESRLDERELVTDAPGRTTSGGSGNGPEHRYTYDQRSEKAHQADRFAGEVIDQMEKLRTTGELERVHVIAAPEFLGRLREHYSNPLKKCVAEEVTNRATDRRPEEIRELLPYRM